MIGDSIRTYAHANIGHAVDTERGLLVPTLFGADKMTLAELSAAAAKAAAAKAREGALTPDEMSGGPFTVTNLGSPRNRKLHARYQSSAGCDPRRMRGGEPSPRRREAYIPRWGCRSRSITALTARRRRVSCTICARRLKTSDFFL